MDPQRSSVTLEDFRLVFDNALGETVDGPVVSLDWRVLADLPPGDLQSRLLAETDAVMGGKSGTEEDELLAQLPEPLRAIWLMEWLDFEVTQGSLLAYFFNSHGRHAPLAIDILRRIGARAMADVLAEASASYEDAAAEWQARHDQIDAGAEYAVTTPYSGLSNARDLSVLTDRYWQAADTDGWWGDKLNAYLSEQVRLLAG